MKKMTIMKEIEDHKKKVCNKSPHWKFMLYGNIDDQEETMDCNNIIDHMEKQGEEPLHWELCHTVS